MSGVDFAEVERHTDQVRIRLNLGNAPIPDITSILEDAGLVVLVRPLGEFGPDGLYVRRDQFSVALLNGDKYLPRLRFTGAHELGHHEYGAVSALDEDIHGSAAPEETRANAFAASFLMPREALAERVGGRQPVPAELVLDVANEFGVSYETLVYRLHNTRLLRGGAAARDSLLAERSFLFTADLRQRRLETRSIVPSDYVVRAVRAYRGDRISLDRLAELLYADREGMATALKEAGLLHPEDG